MIARRLKIVFLPVITITLVMILLTFSSVSLLEDNFRKNANQEITRLLGIIAEENPDIDTARIIRAINSQDSKAELLGQNLLREYGYLSTDTVAPSAQNFGAKMFIMLSVCIGGFALLVITYFWYRDWLEECRIKRLIGYLQNLKERTYELKLDENSEDELSFLTNEIYKITVLLKESAENNRLHSQNLEIALADISHQLRTPLTSLQVTLDNIYDDPDMPLSVRQDFLRSASRQVESMSALVMTLLNLAKFDNGSIKLHDQPVQAGELLEEVRQSLEILSEIQGVTIKMAGDLDAAVRFDRRWQREALTNIVKNCIEHSHDGDEVAITVEDCPLYLRFTIKDYGEGIAPEDLRHIFERFYKAKNSSSDSVGIGLAFAKAVIEANNGQISVKSRLGEGTSFDIKYFR